MKTSSPRIDQRRWQAIRANKRNKQTATRIGQLGESASPEHKQVLTDAVQQWAEAVKLSEHFPAITDLLTADAIYHLIYCEEGHAARFERTIAVTVARAIVEGKTAEQCAQLFKSKNTYYKGINDRAEEWCRDREQGIAQPLPPDDDGILDAEYIYDKEDDDILSVEIIIGVSKKPTRRIPITVKRFEKYGIRRGDTAVVVMNGDIRVGELGYCGIIYNAYPNPADYKSPHLAFVCEQDETCFNGYYNGPPRTPESLCLRSDDVKKCQGNHNAEVYGRVCAVERKGQPVEHELKLRPFDGRL